MADGHWEEEINTSVISLVLASGCIGVCVYNETNTDSVPCNSDDLSELFNMLKIQFNPSLFIIHPNIVEKANLLSMLLRSEEGVPDHYQYKVEKRLSWDSESALKLLSSRFKIKSKSQNNIPCSYINILKQESSVNLENTPSLQSMNVMLLHVIGNIYSLTDMNEAIIINAIEPLEFSKYMRIDANTYYSLQIFHEEYHPNIVQGQFKMCPLC